MNPRIRRVSANSQGRDFVIGDLHGCLDQLQDKLNSASFEPERGDRLFAVGDLVDRGPDSLGCLKLLQEPWFFSVLGNHDQMFWMLWPTPAWDAVSRFCFIP
jgi:serine/threonine protein phosphatase 1